MEFDDYNASCTWFWDTAVCSPHLFHLIFCIYVSLLLFSVLCGYKCACKIRYIKFALSFSETHFKVFVGLWLSMMGALGNGRRGGRSPSLLVAALIACILLLGFNYWVSSSRNIELQVWHSVIRCSLWQVVKWVAVNYNLLFVVLQSRILEMESRMRQLAADRDREQQSKLKAEEETRRQNEQLELMEETHQRQQENTLNTWKQERVWKHSSYTHSQQFRWKLRDTDRTVLDHYLKNELFLL